MLSLMIAYRIFPSCDHFKSLESSELESFKVSTEFEANLHLFREFTEQATVNDCLSIGPNSIRHCLIV